MARKNSVCRTQHNDIDGDRLEFHELVKSLARITAGASHKLGIGFDVDDPQVAQELLVVTFDAVIRGRNKTYSAKSRVPVPPSKTARKCAGSDSKIKG